MLWKIQHNKPTVGAEEAIEATRIINSLNLAQGEEVEKFEDELCVFLGLRPKHAVAVSSGTAALYMAIRALDIKNKVSDVAIPAYSCVALKNAVLMAGKSPLYVDVGEKTPNIDMESCLVKDASLTIACHMYGMPMKLGKGRIIEDCAQSIGAVAGGRPVGTQTDIGVFSFYATKPMTCGGEGGAVVSSERGYIDFIKELRDFDGKNDAIMRFNLKMTDLQASIGRVQLRKLPDFIKRRNYLADRYEQQGISLWRSSGGINYRGLVSSVNPRNLVGFLKTNGVQAILPIEERELLCDPLLVPKAYNLTKRLVSIPLYPLLTDNEQDFIIRLLKDYIQKEGDL